MGIGAVFASSRYAGSVDVGDDRDVVFGGTEDLCVERGEVEPRGNFLVVAVGLLELSPAHVDANVVDAEPLKFGCFSIAVGLPEKVHPIGGAGGIGPRL